MRSDESAPEIAHKPAWAKFLVFLAFFPYPSIVNAGASSGVQLGQALCAIVFMLRLPAAIATRSWKAFLLLVVPIIVSYSLLTISDRLSSPDIATRALISTAFILIALPAFGGLVAGATPNWMVTPVALAILVHFTIVLYQLAAFDSGVFPLISLYQNPDFADLAAISRDYALYTGRPMGLFPEPSAMAAAIGPWSIWLLHIGLSPAGRRRKLAMLGGLGGIAAILLGASVYGLLILFAIPATLLSAPLSKGAKRAIIALTGVLLIALGPLLLDDRVLGNNESRVGRFESIREAVRIPFADAGSLFLGRGVGQTGTLFQEMGVDFSAVYSIMADRFVSEGLLAIAAMIAIGWMVVSRIRSIVWGTIAILLFASLAFTTSYLALLPIWLMLATLLDAELTTARTEPLGSEDQVSMTAGGGGRRVAPSRMGGH